MARHLWLFISLVPPLILLSSANGTAPAVQPTTPARPNSVADSVTPKAAEFGFYSSACSADTFQITLRSFATIWTVLDLVVLFVSAVVFVMYLCFHRFVTRVVTS